MTDKTDTALLDALRIFFFAGLNWNDHNFEDGELAKQCRKLCEKLDIKNVDDANELMQRMAKRLGRKSLYNQANTLCNSIDGAALRTREQTNPCNHGVNIALGKLGQAFKMISETRQMLGEAEKELEEWVDFDAVPEATKRRLEREAEQ